VHRRAACSLSPFSTRTPIVAPRETATIRWLIVHPPFGGRGRAAFPPERADHRVRPFICFRSIFFFVDAISNVSEVKEFDRKLCSVTMPGRAIQSVVTQGVARENTHPDCRCKRNISFAFADCFRYALGYE
jgi:hypothetical protein